MISKLHVSFSSLADHAIDINMFLLLHVVQPVNMEFFRHSDPGKLKKTCLFSGIVGVRNLRIAAVKARLFNRICMKPADETVRRG